MRLSEKWIFLITKFNLFLAYISIKITDNPTIFTDCRLKFKIVVSNRLSLGRFQQKQIWRKL